MKYEALENSIKIKFMQSCFTLWNIIYNCEKHNYGNGLENDNLIFYLIVLESIQVTIFRTRNQQKLFYHPTPFYPPF